MKLQPRVRRSSQAVKGRAAPGGPAVDTCRTVPHPQTGPLAQTEAEGEEVGRDVLNPAPVRIGYVLDQFPRASHDFVRQEILQLERLGFEVHVFSLAVPDGRLDDSIAALARVRGPVDYVHPRHQAEQCPDAPAGDLTAALASRIANKVVAARIEHLHAHLATGPTDVVRAVTRLTGIPYSFTAHSEGLYDAADSWALREKVGEATFVVTLSESDRGHLLRVCGAEVGPRIRSIPMGIDLEESRFASAEYHDSDSVLAVGPLVEKSGFADLIDAIRMLRARGRFVRLTIVGEGELGLNLQEQVDRARLGDRVKLLGGVSRLELAIMMRVHCAMALPWVADQRDRDVLANLVLESMAIGLVVISTDLPGIREMVDDGLNGRLIMPHDPLWLAGALETLLENPGLRARMAVRARAKVERRFSAATNISDLARLFKDAIARRIRHVNGAQAAGD